MVILQRPSDVPAWPQPPRLGPFPFAVAIARPRCASMAYAPRAVPDSLVEERMRAKWRLILNYGIVLGKAI